MSKTPEGFNERYTAKRLKSHTKRDFGNRLL